jgi:hypothetical protein
MKIKPLHIIAGILLFVLVVPSLLGQSAPTNDTCVNAIALTNGVPYTQDTTLATELGQRPRLAAPLPTASGSR